MAVERAHRRIRPRQRFAELYAWPPTAGFWNPPPRDPGAEHLFTGSIYVRGAMTLQALRERIGDRSFFALPRAWYRVYRDAAARTSDLIALAERVSGRELSGLFDAWLYVPGKPTSW